MSAPFLVPERAEPCPAFGCSWCGPWCERCFTRPANRDRSCVLAYWRNLQGHHAGGFHYEDGERVPLIKVPEGYGAELVELVRERPNRHDRRRAAAGNYCYCDGPDCPDDLRGIAAPATWAPGTSPLGEKIVRYYRGTDEVAGFDNHPYRGRRVRDAGAEWALMCRRVEGAVLGLHNHLRSMEYPTVRDNGTVPTDDDLNAVAYRRRATRGGRKTQLLRAIIAGGWRPGAESDLAPEVAALVLRGQHYLRRVRRHKRTRR